MKNGISSLLTSSLTSSQRVLITGASRGIGRATALALARRGYLTVLAARDRSALERVAREIATAGGRAEVLVMDVTSDASVDAAVAALLAGGPCDAVVNNAGSCNQCAFLAQSPETQRAEMELNYWGALRVTRALLPSMIRRGSGTVVNVSSLLGCVAAPGTASYSATKAALNAWSHGLRAEVARFGVRVVVFVAPHTDTESGRRVEFHGVRSLPPEYVAEELVRAIRRAPRQYAASPVYRLLVRLAGMFPVLMENRVAASAPSRLFRAGRGPDHDSREADRVL